MASKVLQVGAVWGLCLGMAAAQVAGDRAPAVPADRYGPPTCGDYKPTSNAERVQRARGQQIAGANDPHAVLSAEPLENLDLVRYRIQDYFDCVGNGGCYWADADAQYKRAEAALDLQITTRKPGQKLAIVMDIDETSLSNYCIMQRENLGYIKGMFQPWVVTPEAATAMPGGLRLFNRAKAAGVAVFFITGRPGVPDPAATAPEADQTAATARNLEAAGYHGWAGLALRNGAENSMATIAYKSAERKKIADKGYRIVLSIGDQWSDLLGDPQAEISVKVPNPFYFLP